MRWHWFSAAAAVSMLAGMGCGGAQSGSQYPTTPQTPARQVDRRLDHKPIEIDRDGGQSWPAPVPNTYRAAPGRSCERLPVKELDGTKRVYLVPAPPGVSADADRRGEIVVRWRVPKATGDCRPQAIRLFAVASHSYAPIPPVAEVTEPIHGQTNGVSRLRFANELVPRKPDRIIAVLIPAKAPSGIEGRRAEAMVALPDCRPGGPKVGCTLGRPPLPTTASSARAQLAHSEVLPGRLQRIACDRGAERSIVCDITSIYDGRDRKVRHSARVILRPQYFK